jgi:hypothetical protein
MLKSLFKKPNPEPLTISPDQLVTLAIEHWRLSQALGERATPPARHALRKIADLLASFQVEVQSLDGLQYDAGMSVTVIDRISHPAVPPGIEAIIETVSPLILLKGQVLKTGEVIVGKSE